MKIALSDIAEIGTLKTNLKYLVKVLKYNNNSTLIQIKGHSVSVPFLLSKDKNYTARIHEGKLLITEADQQKSSPSAGGILPEGGKEENARKLTGLLTSLLQERDKTETEPWLSLTPFFPVKDDPGKEPAEKSFPFLLRKSSDNSYYLFFNLPVYDIPAKVSCRISRDKRVLLNLLLTSETQKSCDKVREKLQDHLGSLLKNKPASIHVQVTCNENDFVSALQQQTGLSNIDMLA